jgi:hypothetical protein
MLQHTDINTFVRHYSVRIHVDAQAIVRGLPAQKQLMRFACSMIRYIDPRRPYKLKDSSAINDIPRVRDLQELVQKRKKIRDDKIRSYETGQALHKAFGEQRYPKKIKDDKKPSSCHRWAHKGVKKSQDEYTRANQRYCT